MEKNKNKLKIILAILILIFLFIIISSTFSKYYTESSGLANVDISIWHIKVNDFTINDSTRDYFRDVEIKYTENEHMSNTVIVPSAVGTFEVVIESTETKVPFNFEFQITDPDIEDLEITKCNKNSDSTPLAITDGKVTGTIDPIPDASGDIINKFYFTIMWKDTNSSGPDFDANEVSDNIGDVTISSTRPSTTIPISLKVTQKDQTTP